jgi:hypothetical protein
VTTTKETAVPGQRRWVVVNAYDGTQPGRGNDTGEFTVPAPPSEVVVNVGYDPTQPDLATTRSPSKMSLSTCSASLASEAALGHPA